MDEQLEKEIEAYYPRIDDGYHTAYGLDKFKAGVEYGIKKRNEKLKQYVVRALIAIGIKHPGKQMSVLEALDMCENGSLVDSAEIKIEDVQPVYCPNTPE
jgi:hypothetical protein